MTELTITRSGSIVSVYDEVSLRVKNCKTPAAAIALEEALKAARTLERRQLEAGFNAEIVRRYRDGASKEAIVADLGISRKLFNRVVRAG